ncbi:MAG TPA: Uma2 family endonuclease [Polyangiaceae bacterium]|jgi:Uma2 family endonuclease
MTSPVEAGSELPPVDARLVAPDSRYEIEDGRIRYVAPADEPHGTRHFILCALLEAHVREEYAGACDMLTRTSKVDDMAPDASVFPRARDPETGGRRLEELAFEIVSTEALSDAGRKAQKLMNRGVRRVFAVDVSRQRALEWSTELASWRLLDPGGFIEDKTLAAALPLEALVHAAKADDAIARALLAKHNPVLEGALAQKQLQGRAEGKAEALLRLLEKRGFILSAELRERVSSCTDAELLDRWFDRAVTATTVDGVF